MTVYQRKSMAIATVSAHGGRVMKLKKQDGYLITFEGQYITLKSLVELEAFAQAKRQVEEFLNNLAKTSLSTKAMLGEIQNQVEKNVNIVKEVDLKKADSLKSILIETKK